MSDFFYFLLFIIAPVVQIWLSVLRLKRKTNLPLIAIVVIALLLGILISFAVGGVFIAILPHAQKPTGPDGPGVAGIYLAISGIAFNLISAPIIGIICFIVWQHKQSPEADPQL